MSKPIGKMLLDAGLLTPAQLEEAIQNQVIFGGKLGTNLLELGLINIPILSKALSKKFSCPTINPFKLKPTPPEALQLVGRKLALKYGVVPLGVEGNTLDLLMSNPADVLAADEINFVTRKRIKTFVSPEVVVYTLLEKYYGIKRDFRYKQLAAKVLKPPRLQEPLKKHEPGKPVPRNKDRPEIKGLDFDLKEDLASEEVFETLIFAYQRKDDVAPAQQAAAPPAPPLPPPPPMNAALPPVPPAPPPPPQEEPLPILPPLPPQRPKPAARPPAPQMKVAVPPPPVEPEPEMPAVIETPPPHRGVPSAPDPDKTIIEAAAEEEEILDLEELVQEPVVSMDEAAESEPEKPEEEEEEILEEVPEALTLQEAMKRLTEVTDRDELSKVVLAFALSYFKRAALFITRGGVAMGWDGMGGSMNRKNIQSIMLPLNSASIFKTVHDSMAFFLGTIPQNPINDRFLKLTGGEKPRSAFLIPILFGGKVVNILYGDNGNNENAPTDISDLLILAPRVPQAFEGLIRRKKQQAAKDGLL